MRGARLTMPLALVCLLAFVIGVAAAPKQAPLAHVDPQVVKTQVKDVLSAPEYNRMLDRGRSPFYERIMRAIGRFVGWLFHAFDVGGGRAGRVVSYILACLVIAAFLVLVALIVRKLMGMSREREQEERSSGMEDFELLSATPLIRQAGKLAEAGDYRGAFRCAYLASIAHLDEIDALRFEQSRTNWEYLRDLEAKGLDDPYQQLRPLTLDFDRKFYGRESCTLSDYRGAIEAYHRISGEVAA